MTPSEAPPERLHPSSLVFGAGSAARRLLLPGLAVLLFSRGSNFELLAMVFFLPALTAAVLRYVSYRYHLAEDELIVRQGIVNRSERHIPYVRIQNIDLVQNVLHRALGVAEVRIETASGDKPEAVMRVLSLEAVERMRDRVFREKASATTAAPREAEAEVLLRLPGAEIVRYGLISNRGMVVVAALVGALWQLDVIDRLGGAALVETARGRLAGLDRLGSTFDPAVTAALALLLLLAIIVALRLLSIVLALFRFYDFRLTLQGEDLRAESGLATRVTKTIPRHRVQLATVSEGALHRLFGRVTVEVETAGGGSDEEGEGARRLQLAPILPRERTAELLARVIPGLEFERVDWQPVAPRAWLRLFRPASFVIALAATVAGVLVRPAAALVAVPALGLALLHARRWQRTAGWAEAGEFVLWRSGWWRRSVRVTRHAKIQALRLVSSPFDRRHDMASLRVDTAGARGGGPGLDLRLLQAPVAARLLEELSAAAGRTAFRW